jgi:chromosome segregation ATPase
MFGRILVDYEIGLEDLRAHTNAVTSERDLLQARQNEISDEQVAAAAELTARAEQAEQALDAAIRDKEAFSQSLAASVAERDALHEKNARVAAELLARQQELAEHVAAAAAELAVYAERAERMHAENTRIAAELLMRQQELAEQTAAVAELAAHADKVERALEEAERDKASLSQTLAASAAGLADMRLELGEIAHKYAEALKALELVRGEKAAIEAKHVDLAANLDRALEEKHGLAAHLDLMSAELQRVQQASGDRASAQEAAHARALAEAQKVHEAQIRTSRGQLVDAEAALSHSTAKHMHAGIWAKLLPARFQRRQAARRLIRSGLFDSSWYLAQYPDVGQSGLGTAEHYLEIGFCHGYKPNPFFDTRSYLTRYEDVLISGMNPLLHYFLHGFREGRDPGPGFDNAYYLETNPDVRANGMNPLAHYLRYGRHEGRLPVRPG